MQFVPALALPVEPPQAPSYHPLPGFPGLPLERGLRRLCSRGRAAGPRVTGEPVTSGGTAPRRAGSWAGTWGQEIDYTPTPVRASGAAGMSRRASRWRWEAAATGAAGQGGRGRDRSAAMSAVSPQKVLLSRFQRPGLPV